MLRNWYVRRISIMVAVLLLSGFGIYAQVPAVPVGPTSATDANVKIHKKISLFRHSKQSKKIKGQARITEREGRAFSKKTSAGYTRDTEREGKSVHKKRTPPRPASGKQARVFKRQNHFAKTEINMRKKANRRQTLLDE